jgi:hypothetical protein
MAAPRSESLLRLAAELTQEVARIDRTALEGAEAEQKLAIDPPDRLTLYAAAAILETFYTGIEKALSRVAPTLNGGLPEGQAWHRRLLENMSMPIPGVRPAVLAEQAARALDPYLSFRHRFRNLYLFDLEAEPVRTLLAGLPRAWALARGSLVSFGEFLKRLAEETSA